MDFTNAVKFRAKKYKKVNSILGTTSSPYSLYQRPFFKNLSCNLIKMGLKSLPNQGIKKILYLLTYPNLDVPSSLSCNFSLYRIASDVSDILGSSSDVLSNGTF